MELSHCYEYEAGESTINKFLEETAMGPTVFLLRSLYNQIDYDETKNKVLRSQRGKEGLAFEVDNTFAGKPVEFPERGGRRLVGKFLGTTRVVHCARRPSLEPKECLFDAEDVIKEALNNYRGKGRFALIYTMWNQVMCDAVGMGNTRKLAASGFRNPVDNITPHLLTMAKSSLGI